MEFPVALNRKDREYFSRDALTSHAAYPCRWQELLQEYPDAKVILTTRDTGAWWTSLINTVHNKGRCLPGEHDESCMHLDT